jgi:hypothetical protein
MIKCKSNGAGAKGGFGGGIGSPKKENEPRSHEDTKRLSWFQNDSANLALEIIS